jgi:Zn-dependent metalloprotease
VPYKFLIILLFGACLAETRFYYSENNITEIDLSSDILVAIDNNQDFEYFKNKKIDQFGNTHLILQQSYDDIPVFGRYLRAHFNSDGELSSVSSNIHANLKIKSSPILSALEARNLVKSYIISSNMSIGEPRLNLLIKNDIPILCYKIDAIGFEDAWRYFINTTSGEVEDIHSLINYDGPTTGSGINLLEEHIDNLEVYEGSGFGSMGGDLITPNLVCEAYCWDYGDCDNQNYNSCDINPQQGICPDAYLEDCNGECFHSWYMQFPGVGNGFCNDPWIEYEENNIETGNFNMVDESNIDIGRIFTINSYGGFYEDLSYVSSDTDSFSSIDESLSHRAGVSAHDYQRKTQDYMWNHHGYAGIDGLGKRVVSVINYSGASGISQNNAFFNAAIDVLTYGIGSGNYRPFCAAQDIVSHEYGHGFTAHTSGLIYRNQSGALNESISDALGFFVEAEYQDDWNWVQGEDVHLNGNASRSFIHPPAYGDPDNINHPYFVPYNNNPVWSNDFGGVHTNLGIPNKILYLVIQGDAHYGVDVPAFSNDFDISRGIASNIWFNWNAYYLGPEDDFSIAREKMLQACYDLYPNNSSYYQTVSNAWASTGVGSEFYLGNANGDSVLNIQDIILILQYVLGNYDLNEFQIFTVDINQDETIDVLDIIQVVNNILYGI